MKHSLFYDNSNNKNSNNAIGIVVPPLNKMDSENKGLKKEDFERINKDFNRYSNNMSKANIDTINNKIKT